MKDVSKMTLEEINAEVKQARDAAFCGRSHPANKKPRRKALEARHQYLMNLIANSPEIVNPLDFEEGQG